MPERYFVDIDKLILQFIRKVKRSRLANTILKKKNKVGRPTLPDFKTYFKTTVINTGFYWRKNRHIFQWNTTEAQKEPHINISNLVLTKDQRQFDDTGYSFQQMVVEKLDVYM